MIGARVVVSYSPDGWVNPKLEYGVKLYLEAVQVKSNAGAARAAADYGFAADAPEEGEESIENGEAGGGGETAETPDF